MKIGTSWEKVREKLEQHLSEHYGNEILLSPEFQYEPYLGFKPKNILELSENPNVE